MKTKTQKFIFASALSLALITLSGSLFAASNVSQDIVDARQEAQIWTTYALSPYLRANELQVSVHKGKATLTGTVEADIGKDLAKEIALGVKGVEDVDNNIVVNADYNPQIPTSEERSYGQVIDDASISAAVKSKLLWSKNTSGLSTHVDTRSGKVTLQGEAESGAAKDLAGRMAKNTQGVVKVDNQIIVMATSNAGMMSGNKKMHGSERMNQDEMMESDDNMNNGEMIYNAKNTTNTVSEEVSDSWITTKVKYTFIYSSNVDSSDISVSTKDGIVTLSGKMGSGAERELAIELAKNIRGVNSVMSKDLVI